MLLFIPNSALAGLMKAKQPYFIVAVVDPNDTGSPLAKSGKTPLKISQK